MAHIEMKQRVRTEFDRCFEQVRQLSRQIAAHPEIGFEEFATSASLIHVLEREGFSIKRGVGGLETAFIATLGNGSLTVGLMAELDALPEIGHACGHNTIAAAAVGAALSLAEVADQLEVQIRVFGSPAEESGGGKIVMQESGVFLGTHAILLTHPATKDMVVPRIRALRRWQVDFEGRQAHASRPHTAQNAADAVAVSQVAIGLLRQQLADGVRVHYSIVGDGSAVNVIPGRSSMECVVRADELSEVDAVWERVRPCFIAGAMASGTTVRISEPLMTYSEFQADPDLAEAFRTNAMELGRTFPDYDDMYLGSTDFANLSLERPALHPVLSLAVSPEHGSHTREFAAACASSEGDRFVHDAGLAMAWTIVDIASTAAVRARLVEHVTP